MQNIHILLTAGTLAPAVLMGVAAVLPRLVRFTEAAIWRVFLALAGASLGATALVALTSGADWPPSAGLRLSRLGLVMALVVQLLGTAIGGFSARYLKGEPGQGKYVACLSGVLAAVHLLLMADHWGVLILAWAWVGVALQPLLCFYPDRPFARLAAYKKAIADRCADALLVGAAALAYSEVGSLSLSAFVTRLNQGDPSIRLKLSAVGLVLAVVLRTALLPVHGWLIQVMEAPTPVSALLHAGVVNLGGYVLIRFSPVVDRVMPCRVLLVAFGLGTAVLAGIVMLTRVSIKVRLAWSTTAQMGFMLLECGLGLNTFAALHLIGHSFYKAASFLSASTVVRRTGLEALHTASPVLPLSLALAPLPAISVVQGLEAGWNHGAWPWWWSASIGLAWAPLLWASGGPARPSALAQAFFGLLLVTGLTALAKLGHALPLGVQDAPQDLPGLFALGGMLGLYGCVALLQVRPQALGRWRRWSYAGFYLDETFTRLALQLRPARWMPDSLKIPGARIAPSTPANAAN